MEYKKMREYSHEELVNLIMNMSEDELIKFSYNYGGYPVLIRKALDEKICHIPFIQDGAAIIMKNSNNEILLQERMDNGRWGLPGGCQELSEQFYQTAIREAKEETNIEFNEEDLNLVDIISGIKRRRTYPNGDIVYNNTVLYVATIKDEDLKNIKWDSESKRLSFFKLDELPENLHDEDLIDSYKKLLRKRK